MPIKPVAPLDLKVLQTALHTARIVDEDRDTTDTDPKLDALSRIERMIAGLVVLASLDRERTETRDARLFELITRVEAIGKRFGL